MRLQEAWLPTESCVKEMREACEKKGVQFYHPSPIFVPTMRQMIGVAAYYDFIHGQRDGLDLNAVPNLKLGER